MNLILSGVFKLLSGRDGLAFDGNMTNEWTPMMIKRPKPRSWMLKKEIIILYYALRDKRTTVAAKLPAILSIIYLLSPVDLIPDFIPFFGYVDDIIIVPLLLNLAVRLLPLDVRGLLCSPATQACHETSTYRSEHVRQLPTPRHMR